VEKIEPLVGRINHVIDLSASLDCGEKVNRVVEKINQVIGGSVSLRSGGKIETRAMERLNHRFPDKVVWSFWFRYFSGADLTHDAAHAMGAAVCVDDAVAS